MSANRYIAENIYGEKEPPVTEEMKSGFNEGMGNATCRSGELSDRGNWRLKEGWEKRYTKPGWGYEGKKGWVYREEPLAYKHPVPEWEPIRYDEDYYLASDAVIKAANPDHKEYSIIVERTTHAHYAYYSNDEIYYSLGGREHTFPQGYSSSGNGPEHALANLAVEIHKQRSS